MKFEDFAFACDCNGTSLKPFEHAGDCTAVRVYYRADDLCAQACADERKRIMEGAERVYGYEHKHGTSWHSEGEPSFQFTALLIQITPLKEEK